SVGMAHRRNVARGLPHDRDPPSLMRSVEIMGGGLAGLALGLGLRHRGVPVTVCEAGSYPRHRACGEFIHGLETSVIERLGLAPVLADAPRCHRVSWHQGTTAAHAKQWRLLRPALVVS